MRAGTYNSVIEQGAVWRRVFTFEDGDGEPIDLTGYTARMHIRKADFSVDTVLELTTGNGRISIDGNTLTLLISAIDTTLLEAGDTVFDLELVPPAGEAETVRMIEGKLTISREVTRG